MSRRKNWERVQVIEKAYHEAKDSSKVRDINMVYFRRILEEAGPDHVNPPEGTTILDVGCGGCGILLAIEGGKRTGMDPLMNYYLDKFPFLREEDVEWREGMAEDLGADEKFDRVYSINMLDHVAEPPESALNFQELLAPGGTLVLLLNTHLSRASRRYFELFYRFIDPPHPHHFYREDVPKLFPGLELVSMQDADSLWLDLKKGYDREIRGRDRVAELKRLLKKVINPFKYPLAAWRFFLNRPVFRRKNDENPLIAATLYVLKKPAAA